MSAWSSDWTQAPKDEALLARSADWDCPAVVYWLEEEQWEGWVFMEPVLQDMSDPLEAEELARCEWALIPG